MHNNKCIDFVNPLVPDALQIQRLEVDLNLNFGFLFFAPWTLMG